MDDCCPGVLTEWSYLNEGSRVRDLALSGWIQESHANQTHYKPEKQVLNLS